MQNGRTGLHRFIRKNGLRTFVCLVLILTFDQLDAVDDLGGELVLRFEEDDGIAKLARLTSSGLDVELFHILTFT